MVNEKGKTAEAAGCTVLLVRSPGLQLVLPGIPAAQATALAAVLMEGSV